MGVATIFVGGKTIQEISEETGIPAVTLYRRYSVNPKIKYETLILPKTNFPRPNSRTRYLVIRGQRKCLSEWSRVTGISLVTICHWNKEDGEEYTIKRIMEVLDVALQKQINREIYLSREKDLFAKQREEWKTALPNPQADIPPDVPQVDVPIPEVEKPQTKVQSDLRDKDEKIVLIQPKHEPGVILEHSEDRGFREIQPCAEYAFVVPPGQKEGVWITKEDYNAKWKDNPYANLLPEPLWLKYNQPQEQPRRDHDPNTKCYNKAVRTQKMF